MHATLSVSLMNILHSLIRSPHFPSSAILISVSCTVSVLTWILNQPVPSLPLLSTLNLSTVTLSTTIFPSLQQIQQITRCQQIQNCVARTILWLKLLNLLISHPSSDVCTGSRSLNALNINSFHSAGASGHKREPVGFFC